MLSAGAKVGEFYQGITYNVEKEAVERRVNNVKEDFTVLLMTTLFFRGKNQLSDLVHFPPGRRAPLIHYTRGLSLVLARHLTPFRSKCPQRRVGAVH